MLSLGGDSLKEIFKAEVGFGLLGDFLIVLNDQFEANDSAAIVELLLSFSQTKRFDLNVGFLSKNEKAAVSSLLPKLMSTQDGEKQEETLKTVKQLYKV